MAYYSSDVYAPRWSTDPKAKVYPFSTTRFGTVEEAESYSLELLWSIRGVPAEERAVLRAEFDLTPRFVTDDGEDWATALTLAAVDGIIAGALFVRREKCHDRGWHEDVVDTTPHSTKFNYRCMYCERDLTRDEADLSKYRKAVDMAWSRSERRRAEHRLRLVEKYRGRKRMHDLSEPD